MDNQNNNPLTENKKTHVGLSIIVACLMISCIAMFSTVPLMELIGVVAFAGFACVYSILLSSGNTAATFIPVVWGMAMAALSVFVINGPSFSSAMQCINTVIAVCFAVVLHICNRKKAKKSVVFAVATVAGTLSILIALVLAVFIAYGSVSTEILSEALTSFANAVGETYKQILTTAAADMGSNQELVSLVDDLAYSMSASIQVTFISTVVVYSMLFAAYIVLIYRHVSRIMGYESKVFEERPWIFSLSGVSAVFFEIMFTVYIFSMLIRKNTVILVAFVNLVNIMIVPFGYVGIKYVYRLLRGRIYSKSGVIAIIIAAAVILTVISGFNTFFMVAALAGASSVFKEGITPKGNDSDDKI